MAEHENPFARLTPDAEGHFRLLFYSAILSITSYLGRLSHMADSPLASVAGRFAFLEAYEAELRGCIPEGVEGSDALRWWRVEVRNWEKQTKARLPLRALAENLDLAPEQ